VTAGGAFGIGVTPETLLVDAGPADAKQTAIADAAAYLHDRDILQMGFLGDVPLEALQALLRMFAVDAAERRQRGGPAQMWIADGHPSIIIEQVDYRRVLERERGGTAGDVPDSAKRDDVWKSIVTSIVGGQTGIFDQAAQLRLLAIAGSPG